MCSNIFATFSGVYLNANAYRLPLELAERWRIARKFVAVLCVINIIAVNGPSTTSNWQQNVATVSTSSNNSNISSSNSPTRTSNCNNNTNHNIGNGATLKWFFYDEREALSTALASVGANKSVSNILY